LIGQKWVIKIMYDLIDNYLPILINHYVNGRLTCGGKTGAKTAGPDIPDDI